MTQQEMMFLVPRKLKEIEKEYGIRVLYAAESGSRAWGTCSQQSDFDVRFIYIRPRKEYLRLEQTRDVLEFPIEEGWDMSGWDLRKTLQLLYSSNSQIYEWFHSPIVYVDDGFSKRICPVLDASFSKKTVVYHYLHQSELKKKKQMRAEETKVKHYLYRLQYLSAARWVLDFGLPIPVSFRKLMARLPEHIQQEAQALLLRKTTQPHLPMIPQIPHLDAWLEKETDDIQQELSRMPKEEEKSWERLDSFFLEELERSKQM